MVSLPGYDAWKTRSPYEETAEQQRVRELLASMDDKEEDES